MRLARSTTAVVLSMVIACPLVACATIYWTPAHELAPVGWGGYMAAGDLDGDGDFDLSLLDLSPPHVYWNVGSAQAPAWELDITMFSSVPVCVHRSVELADLDGDGDLDLAVACWYDEYVRFYRNTGGSNVPLWEPDFPVLAGIPKEIGPAHPRFADMDADGDLDMMLGSWSGRVMYAQNTGTQTQPQFQYVEWLGGVEYGGGDLSTFGLGDVDGDGDQDLCRVSQSTEPECFENVGTPSAYAFVENPDLLTGVLCPGGAYGMELFDVDADGDPDLLLSVGGSSFLQYLNEGGSSSPVEPRTWGYIKSMYR